jgi:hypothetical protein
MTHTIRMTRDPSHGEPLTADVHPDEVENFKEAGFEVASHKTPHVPADFAAFDHDGDGGGSLPKEPAAAKTPAKRKARK